MLSFLKNTQKKLEKFLVDKDLIPIQEKQDDIFKINYGLYNIFIWKKSLSPNYHEKTLLDKKIKDHNDHKEYFIFNLTNKPIDGIEHEEKVFNLKTPGYPAYTLSFIMEFSILMKDILLSNKGYNINLIFYDTYESVRRYFI